MSSRGPEARPAADGWDPEGPGQRRSAPGGRAPGAHRASRGDGQPGPAPVRDRRDRAVRPTAVIERRALTAGSDQRRFL